MSWKQLVKDYFIFSRRERVGLLTLVLLISFVVLLPKLVKNRQTDHLAMADTAWISAMKQLEVKDPSNEQPGPKQTDEGRGTSAYQYDRSVKNSDASTLFNFDPNKLDAAGWKKLGIKDKTIHTIQNYLSKGGHFSKPEDLKRIYGLRAGDYERLGPYIKIENNRTATIHKPLEYIKREMESERRSHRMICINTADTSDFISLPGIGSKLALRIVSFREKLGGFYSVNQIGETYGLVDSVFQKVKQYLVLENVSVKKININTATLDDLKAHPYIRYAIAKPIVSYRSEHGNFSKIEDLKKVMAVTDEVYSKIAPYLSITD